MKPNLEQHHDFFKREITYAREALQLFKTGFSELTTDEQLREVVAFVLERREELACSPELQQWLINGLD